MVIRVQAHLPRGAEKRGSITGRDATAATTTVIKGEKEEAAMIGRECASALIASSMTIYDHACRIRRIQCAQEEKRASSVADYPRDQHARGCSREFKDVYSSLHVQQLKQTQEHPTQQPLEGRRRGKLFRRSSEGSLFLSMNVCCKARV